MSGFVFTSDWHLADRTWVNRPRLTGDADFSLQQIINFCLEHQAPLLAAGDLFNSDRPDPLAVRSAVRAMDRMQAANLPVYYIEGQHERTTNPWMGIHEHPQNVDGKVFEVPELADSLYGLSWTPGSQLPERLAAIPRSVSFLMCHQVWREHMGLICHPEATITQVPSHIRYVLTGDFHQHQMIEPVPHTWMVSPGSISLRNLGEPAKKAFWYYEGGQFHSVPLQTRPVIRCTIVSEAHLNAFVAELERARDWMLTDPGSPMLDGEPICDVKFTQELPDAYRRITEAAGEAHLFLEELRQTMVEEVGIAPNRQAGDVTLLGCLAEVLPAESDIGPEIVQLLASTKPPAVAVQELVASWADGGVKP